MAIRETTSASRKLGAADALKLAREASRVIVAKGMRVTSLDMKKAPPTDDELLKHMLGPTGNLRAPVIRRGKTVVVGFNEDVYAEELASK